MEYATKSFRNQEVFCHTLVSLKEKRPFIKEWKMVDFHRIRESFLTDVYQEERPVRTGSLKKDGYFEPLAIVTETRIWEKYFLVAQRLDERKKNALLKLEDIIAQKKDLYHLEEAFQKQFLVFNEHVTLNDAKRERAQIRLKENSSCVKMRSYHIEILSEEIEKLKYFKDKFLEQIMKHLIYEDFLRTTLYDFGVRATFNDVITRYCSLVSKKKYLMARSKEMSGRLKIMYQESMDRMITYQECVIEMRRQIYTNMVRYEEAVQRTSDLENLQSILWEACASTLKDLILSVQGIRNLSEMINKRSTFRRQSHVRSEESEKLPELMHDILKIKDTMTETHMVFKKVEACLKSIKRLWGKKE